MPYATDVIAKESDLGQPRTIPSRASSPLAWLPYLAIAALLVAIYYRVAIKLVHDWYTIPDYSHGFLVPFFAAFLIWDKRKYLSTVPIRQT
jgi:hypothetical protein